MYAYARLQQDTDNGNQQFQALAGEAEALVAAFSNAVSFIEPEILTLSQEKLSELLTDADFKEYHFYLENLLRLSKHAHSQRAGRIAFFEPAGYFWPGLPFSVVWSVLIAVPTGQKQ